MGGIWEAFGGILGGIVGGIWLAFGGQKPTKAQNIFLGGCRKASGATERLKNIDTRQCTKYEHSVLSALSRNINLFDS